MDTGPNSYICSITGELMKNAVIDKYGHSYSEEAIREWLRKKQTCPLNNEPLTEGDLMPNLALRSAIDDFNSSMNDANSTISTTTAEDMIQVSQAVPMVALPPPVVKKNNTGELQSRPTVSIGAIGAPQNTITVHTKMAINGSGVPTDADIIIALDRSGSMNNLASKLNDGMTLFHLAQQGVLGVAHSISGSNRLAIVAYNKTAEVVLPLTFMDQKGLTLLEKALANLQPSGQTNIGDAIEVSLELLRKNPRTAVSANVLVLTDGAPNISPPNGEVNALQQYYDTHGHLASISTMCFGYSADSELMSSIARTGNGTYGFIPDSGLLATVLVHYVANLLSTVGTDAQLKVEPLNGVILQFEDNKLNRDRVQETSWGACIQVGTVHEEQSRDMLFKMVLPDDFDAGKPYVKMTFTYFDVQSREYRVFEQTVDETEPHPDSQYQETREALINTIDVASVHASVRQFEDANHVLRTLSNEMKKSVLLESDSPYKGLYDDLTGQVSLGCANYASFERWGKHYVPSLVGAYTDQACNNFKDPGLQDFGGLLFKTIRDRADGIVNELPPPKPSLSSVRGYGGASAPTKPISRAHMQQVYNNRYGGCMDVNGIVVCNGKPTRIGELKAGDGVQTQTGEGIVKAVVFFKGDVVVKCIADGLRITDRHPVLVNNTWVHPRSLPGEYTKSNAVCSVLLKDRSSTILVNGTFCATLAHGIQDNEIATHDYFGTEKVVEDLKQHPNYNTSGRIELSANCFVRNKDTGFITKMNVV